MVDTCRTEDTVSRLELDLVLMQDEQVQCRGPEVQEELVPEDNPLEDQVDKVLLGQKTINSLSHFNLL